MDIDERVLVGDIRKAVKESGDSQLLSEMFFKPQPADKRTDKKKKSNEMGKRIAFKWAHFLIETVPELYRYVEDLWKSTPEGVRKGVIATAQREYFGVFPHWYVETKGKEELFVQMMNEMIYRWGFRGTREMRRVVADAERFIHPEDHDFLLANLLRDLGGDDQKHAQQTSLAQNQKTEHRAESPEYHFKKGEALFTQGKFEDAIEQYRKVIDMDPDFAKAYLFFGNCYFAMGTKGNHPRFHYALPYFEKAVELDPKDPQAWRFLSDAYYQLFDWKSSYKALKVALSLDPELNGLPEALKRDWKNKLEILKLRVSHRKDPKLRELIEEELRVNSKLKEAVDQAREELGFQDPEIKQQLSVK